MRKYLYIVCALLLIGCSDDKDRVSGGDAKATIERVQQQLDDAAAAGEARLDEAMERIDKEVE